MEKSLLTATWFDVPVLDEKIRDAHFKTQLCTQLTPINSIYQQHFHGQLANTQSNKDTDLGSGGVFLEIPELWGWFWGSAWCWNEEGWVKGGQVVWGDVVITLHKSVNFKICAYRSVLETKQMSQFLPLCQRRTENLSQNCRTALHNLCMFSYPHNSTWNYFPT